MTKYRPAGYVPWSKVIILTIVLGISDLYLFFRIYRPARIHYEKLGMSYDYNILIYINVLFIVVMIIAIILRYFIRKDQLEIKIEIIGTSLICKKDKTTRFDINKITEFGTIANGKIRHEEFYFEIDGELIRILTPDALKICEGITKALKGTNKEFIVKKNSIYSFKNPNKLYQVKVIDKK
jgi:hypothetical protein